MALTLASVLNRFSEVVQEPDGYAVPCPAHDDDHPSLRVALSESGNLLLRCRAGCSFAEVLDALGLEASQTFDVEAGDPQVRTATSTTARPGPAEVSAMALYLGQAAERLKEDTDVAREALGYVFDRHGVDADTAFALGLGVDGKGEGGPLPFLGRPYTRVPRLVVPFRDFEGVPGGVQGRDISGEDAVRWCSAVNPKGASWSRSAAFTLATGLDSLIITEGPSDALTAVGAGYDALAIRGAASASREDLERHVDALRDHRVFVAGDRDGAGDRFALTVAEVLGEVGVEVRQLVIPDEPTDGDLSGWREHDPEGFVDALHLAVRAAPVLRTDGDEEEPAEDEDAPRAWDGEALTDLGNAERLRKHFKGRILHSPQVGFFLWDGATWQVDRFEAVRAGAHAVARDLVDAGREMAPHPPGPCPTTPKCAGCRLSGWGTRSQSTRALDSMIRETSALKGVSVDVEDMDAHHHLLAFRNGTVDLRSGEMRDHDPKDRLTRRLAVDYVPSAGAPRWERFLAEVFPRGPALTDFIRRLVGYGITGSTEEQCFAVLWGTGANGKSVFTDTLTHVFRSVTTTTPFSTFEVRPSGGIPNDLAALKGSRLVMASEGEQGRPMAEAVLKRVTGRDLISARFMRREFFEFAPTFLIMLATNFKPKFKGQDEGLWRRVKLIPWERYFTPDERDHRLPDVLRDEAEGIAAWAVRGAVEWYAGGLQEPAAIRDATREYRQTSDALAGFFPGVLVRDHEAQVVGAEAYRAFREWCEEEGLRAHEVWKRQTFYGAMDERGIPRERKSAGVTLMGVRMARPDETADAVRPINPGPAKVGVEPGTAPDLADFLGGPA